MLSPCRGRTQAARFRPVVALWEALGGRVELCALAGKAALRISQASGRLARTIHRLLLALDNPGEPEAVERPDEPHLDARTLLIVDEASMVNLGQWHRLLQAMQAGCRLLMVGDPGQPPPIGFGLVFDRLAQVPSITAELRTVHRQAEASGIPEVSSSIREGVIPTLPPFHGKAGGVFLLPCRRYEIPDRIEEVVNALGGFDCDHALQVVAPINEGDAGVVGLMAESWIAASGSMIWGVDLLELAKMIERGED